HSLVSASKQVGIADVAPGISEALLATAMGLFVAIPAVWAYNRFATGVERLDSVGVLQLMRYARRHQLDFDGIFRFHEAHRALVSAIEDVADERPKKKREYGVH
ncbi:hypothetical protein HKX41_10955, partial [Salinisphaera sp. USBA-960]|nr:hypothetical protein [Salifodinibacter halophilus]